VAIVKQLGPPALVAARFRQDQGTVAFGRQLIGPLVFPFYWVAVKATLCILTTIGLFIVATLVFTRHDHLMQGVIQTGWKFAGLAIPPLLFVTFVFAAIDRYLQTERFAERWDPRTLPPLRPQIRQVQRATSIAGIVIQIIFIAWWLGLPSFPDFIFGKLYTCRR